MKHKKSIIFFTVLCLLLILCIFLSITYGVKSIGFDSIKQAFFNKFSDDFDTNVIKARIPRTVFGIIAGSALAISGALMQSVTKNPIADPSILGINSGASLFVVCGISFFHISSPIAYILLALTGAILTAVLVYGLASVGNGGATPIKLALAGAAAGTALQSLVNTVMLPDTQVMDQFRFWQTGNISGITWTDIKILLFLFIFAFLIANALSSSLNTLALGDDISTSLGLNVIVIRAIGAFTGVLLCAATTALAGPIGFIGLMIPHLTAKVLGPDMKKIIPFSALSGACLLLIADILGRFILRPGELEPGIITALIGAPIFILIIRKVKVTS